MRKEVWFGLSILMAIVIGIVILMPSPENITNGHLGLLMLALIVVTIMLGFPTAFTLMGMGVMFTFLAYSHLPMQLAIEQTLDLMVLRAYSVMTNDVLIAVPLFIFMGYLVERANLIEKLFKSMHLAMARIPGSLAVATIATCAVFATATGIVGAVVTLMGLLAMPAMMKACDSVRLTAGAITAGGCLGMMIPPSVLLIVNGAAAGVSVAKLYAGAFFPGLMLAGLYVLYVIIVAKISPSSAPPLSEEERRVELPPFAASIKATISNKALPGLVAALKGKRNVDVPSSTLLRNLVVTLLPALVFVVAMGMTYKTVTAPVVAEEYGLQEMGFGGFDEGSNFGGGGLAEPEGAESLSLGSASQDTAPAATEQAEEAEEAAAAASPPAPTWFWILLAVGTLIMVIFYAMFSFARLEIFKMMLASFFPLAILIGAVLGSIVFGFATPSEAAAMGAFGGILLAWAYGRLNMGMMKESVYLAAKT